MKNADEGLPELTLKAYGGSPWAALLVCIHIKAKSLDELLRAVVGARKTTRAFDACADAWSIYDDAQKSGADL